MTKKSKKKKKINKRKAVAKKQKSKSGKAKKVTPINKNMLKDIFQEDDVDEQYQRIFAILGVNDENDAQVDMENLETYWEYLENEVKLPCTVTGTEDMGCFSWEEFYNFGPGDEKEYNELRKKYPSFRDEYTLLEFNDGFNEEEGLFVHVQRISDKKKFHFTLADLEGVDKNSKNARLLDDYACWFVNFR